MKIESVVLKAKTKNNLPPVLLVHGAWHAAWCWQEFAVALNNKGYEVHYFSLPGHGGSTIDRKNLNAYSLNDYVDFLSERIDEISPTPIVIGHSMGGALLQIYLQNKILPAAILIASIPRQGTFSLILRIALKFPLTLLKALFTYKSEVIIATPGRARALFFSSDNPIDVNVTQKLLGPESMTILPPLLYWGTFKKINPQTPVYVIAGDKDAITSVAEQRDLARHLDAKVSIVTGQAHCIMLEPKSQLVVEMIDEWIQSL